MIVDLCMYEEGTVPGIAVLLNMDNVSLSHLSRVDLSVAQQFFYFLQVCYYSRSYLFLSVFFVVPLIAENLLW